MANATPVTKAETGAPKKADDILMPDAPAPKAKAAPAAVDNSDIKALQEEALAEGKVAILQERFVRVDN